MAQVDLKNMVLTIVDGTGTPNTLVVKIGEGNLTYSEKRDIQYVKDRGNLDTTREGEQMPCEISFNFVWQFVTGSALGLVPVPITVDDALKQIGGASAWLSTGGACEPYAVDLRWDQNVTCGTIPDERLVFTQFRWEDLDHDSKSGMVSCKGKSNQLRPTASRLTLP